MLPLGRGGGSRLCAAAPGPGVGYLGNPRAASSYYVGIAAIEFQRRDGGRDGGLIPPVHWRWLSSVGRSAVGHPWKGNESGAHPAKVGRGERCCRRSLWVLYCDQHDFITLFLLCSHPTPPHIPPPHHPFPFILYIYFFCLGARGAVVSQTCVITV